MTDFEYAAFEFKLARPPDKETGRFAGYAAVFGNVDLQGDVIERGAFAKTLKERPSVPILWGHDPLEPIGISTSMVEDQKGLRVEGELAMDVQRGREAHALMAMNAVTGLSIGYRAINPTRDRTGARRLKEIALWEFSLGAFPANRLARVTAVKQERDDELVVALRELVFAMRSEPKGSRPRFINPR